MARSTSRLEEALTELSSCAAAALPSAKNDACDLLFFVWVAVVFPAIVDLCEKVNLVHRSSWLHLCRYTIRSAKGLLARSFLVAAVKASLAAVPQEVYPHFSMFLSSCVAMT